MRTATPSSNQQFDTTTACVFRNVEEEDPLGILRKVSSGHEGDTTTGSRRLLEPPQEFMRVAADCENGNPCEVIDAILRNSQAIRHRVSSRQARVLDAYEAESQQLYKELSLLPPTYSQYRAVREKTNSRRRQRTKAAGPTSSTAISHPLNFHLHDRYSQLGCAEVTVEERPTERALEDDGRASEESGREDRNRAGLVCGEEGDARVDSSRPSPEGGGGGAAGKQAVEDQDARRCSTLARVGSAPGIFVARSLAQRQPQRVKGSAQDVPALRRSKVRGRQMVFSLLEAARVEEEHMEDLLLACPVSASEEGGRRQRAAAFQSLNEARRRNARELDALMAEYDPRPSRSRREHTLDTLRNTLPWPEHVPQAASGGGYGDGGMCDEGRANGMHDEEHFRREADSGNHAGEVEKGAGEGGRHEDDVSDDGYYDDDFTGDNRHDSSPEGGSGEGGKQLPPRAGDPDENINANTVDDCAGCQASGNNRGNGDGDISPANGEDDARWHSAGRGGMDSTGRGVDGADGGSGTDEGRTGIPLNARASPVGDDDGERYPVALTAEAKDEDAAREDQGRAGVAGTGSPTKQPATGQRKKPTLPDPNEVNGSVMADPFNMDHIKDLPGLIGGDRRGLSRLVRDTVSYVDPAFPNLEFHRRAAMDRAGYFMPGYKPQVNSPGPDAGAFWLERRQSYRVKMAAPPAPSSSNNDGGGRKKRLHPHHQQQCSRPPVSSAATASTSMPFEADDRARRKIQTPAKGATTPNHTARPMTTAATKRALPLELRREKKVERAGESEEVRRGGRDADFGGV